MKKRGGWIFILSLTLMVFAIFGGENFTISKANFFSFALAVNNEVMDLKTKNAELEAEIFNLKIGNKETEDKLIEAKVYSLYPFSDKSEFMINKGSDAGLKEGMSVLAAKKNLIGRIKKVNKSTSVVQSIFDKEFKIPVRIGDKEADAFYTGSSKPTIGLISNKTAIVPEDLVFSAFSEMPYGLIIGKVKTIEEAGAMKEASVQPIYELKNLRNILVVAD